MPNYFCEICKYQTEKKCNYDKHITSTKHLNKLNGDCCSSATSTTSNSINDFVDNTSTASRIRELENQLKLKDLEMENQLKLKELEMENQLKLKEMQIEKIMIELKHKDEIISILRQQPAPQNNTQLPQNNIQLVTQEIPQKQTKKISVMEYLTTQRTNAPTIEQCYKMMLDSEYNSYLQTIHNELDGKDYNILAPSKSRNSDYKQRGVDNAIEIISKFFNEIPANSRPFYCSNKRKNILYIKTNNGWIKQNDKNKQEFDEILLILAKEALGSVRKAVGSISILFRNRSDSLFRNIYDINYGDWSSKNLSEILNVLFFMVDGKHGLIKSDEELDNERLVVKLLKVQLSKMCHSINNDCETDEE